MADYSHPVTNFSKMPAQLDANAGAQHGAARLFKDQAHNEGEDYLTTMLPMESRPDLPPNMRNWTRWGYIEEYAGYWKYEHITRVLGIALLALGFLTINVFTPGALLMLAASGRLLDLSWWYNFIVHKFGNNRSLVLVD